MCGTKWCGTAHVTVGGQRLTNDRSVVSVSKEGWTRVHDLMSVSTTLVFVCESLWDLHVANVTVLTSDVSSACCVPVFIFSIVES